MGTVTLIHSNGEAEKPYESNISPALKKMQEWVEGYVEHVTVLHNGVRADMFVNEEGRICGKWADRNPVATEIYFATAKARGIDPEDPNARAESANALADSLAIPRDNIINIQIDDKPEGIYGPAILLKGFPPDVM